MGPKLRSRVRERPVSGSPPSTHTPARRRIRAFGASLLLWYGTTHMAASSARAQESLEEMRSTARELGVQGIKAYQAEDFATAASSLEQAFQLFPTPTLGLWSARAQLRLGRWVEAAKRFGEAMARPKDVGDVAVQEQAQRDAATELEALERKIPHLTIHVPNAKALAGLSIAMDDSKLAPDRLGSALPVNPGVHKITASCGEERRALPVELREGESKVVQLDLAEIAVACEKSSAPLDTPVSAENLPATQASVKPSSGSSLHVQLGRIGLVVGAGGILTAAIVAFVASGKCPARLCETIEEKRDYDTLKLTSTVAFWGGAGLAAGGALALFLSPADRPDTKATLGWQFTGDGVKVQGTF